MAGEREPQRQRLADGTVYYGQLGHISYDPDEDKIQCHLCGQWLRCVGGPHLTRKHQWTAAQYRDDVSTSPTQHPDDRPGRQPTAPRRDHCGDR